MINMEIRQRLGDSYPESAVLEDPSFDNSIIGVSSEGSIVYDFFKMCEEFAEENKCDTMEAMDFICYNTLRAIPYCPKDYIKPTILYVGVDEII